MARGLAITIKNKKRGLISYERVRAPTITNFKNKKGGVIKSDAYVYTKGVSAHRVSTNQKLLRS